MPFGLRLVLLGAPGAGKGTQAKRIASACGLPHISTGDMFRAEVQAGSDLGREVQQILQEGRLVPDELTVRMLNQRLDRDDAAAGFVLDGFPRTKPQAQKLDELLAARGQSLSAAIDLEVDDEEIVERLTARRTCPACGAIYNLKYSPPREDERCDNREQHGPVKLEQRSDDTEAVIRQRLEVYHEATEPVIEYYRQAGVLETVLASGVTPEDVFAQVEAVLARKGAAPAQ